MIDCLGELTDTAPEDSLEHEKTVVICKPCSTADVVKSIENGPLHKPRPAAASGSSSDSTSSSTTTDRIIDDINKRMKILQSKRIKLHTPELIGRCSGQRRYKLEFENNKYLELMRYTNMRALDKTTLRGVVGESYTEYIAQKEMITAQKSTVLADKIKRTVSCNGQRPKINMIKVQSNIDRLKSAKDRKVATHNKLKKNWQRLASEGLDDKTRLALYTERNTLTGIMKNTATEMKRATDALRKSSKLTVKKIRDIESQNRQEIPGDNDSEVKAEGADDSDEDPEELERLAIEVKAEGADNSDGDPEELERLAIEVKAEGADFLPTTTE